MEQGPERERKWLAQEAGGGFDLIKGEGKTGASETGWKELSAGVNANSLYIAGQDLRKVMFSGLNFLD